MDIILHFHPDAVTLIVNTEHQQPLLGRTDDKKSTPTDERSTHPVNEGGSAHPDEQHSPPAVGEQALKYKQYLPDRNALTSEIIFNLPLGLVKTLKTEPVSVIRTVSAVIQIISKNRDF